MSQLELVARRAWVEWGSGYALFGQCAICGEIRHVRGKRRSWMLCLDCFDLSGPRVLLREQALNTSDRREQPWT